jgi:acyl-CoA hydrolase
MVAVGDDGKSTVVQPLEPESVEGKRRFKQAQQRRELRQELEQRYQQIREDGDHA